MKINVETPYNVGDKIYIFNTENVMKYKDLLISKLVTFKDICEYLCVRCTVDSIRSNAYIKKGVIETEISLHLYRPFKNLHNLRELYISELEHNKTPHPRSEIKEYNDFELFRRSEMLGEYDIIIVEDGLFSPLDKSILNSNSIIDYLKNKYSDMYLDFKDSNIKFFKKINKHLEEYNFEYPDILDILVSELVNNIAIYSADRIYKRDATYSWSKYGQLTSIDLRYYNKHIIKCTQNINSSIIPLISLGIIGEITVDEFKNILKIN